MSKQIMQTPIDKVMGDKINAMVQERIDKREAALATWRSLNNALATADEEKCMEFMDAEEVSRARTRFLLRIHSRYNKLRAHREREQIKNNISWR